MPFGQPDAADVEARAERVGDQLGRAATDVDHHGAGLQRTDAGERHRGLLVAGEQPGGESVRPLDLAQERLAVLGVAHGARRDRERPLGAQLLGLAAEVAECVAHPRDRKRQKPPPSVDAFTEACDASPPDELGRARRLRRRQRAGVWRSCRGRSPRRASFPRHHAADRREQLARLGSRRADHCEFLEG